MEIKLSEEQMEIARQARRFFENETPMDYVRNMFGSDQGYTEDIWEKMVGMGWTAMYIPEMYGGLGMDFADLNVVLEEMGRAVIPGPFFSTVLLAAEILKEAGSNAQKEEYLHGVSSGRQLGTMAIYEEDSGSDPEYIQMNAVVGDTEVLLNGTKVFVMDAHVSDFLVVAARTSPGDEVEKGVTLFIVDAKAENVNVTLLPTMDGTRKLCRVEFNGVKVDRGAVLGEIDNGWSKLKKVLEKAQVGLCAECIGGAQRAMEYAVEYAKVRIQFDQPIGAFQAIKHRCAQMYVEVESARSLLYWAAWAQDHCDARESALAASLAKAFCSEIYKNVARSAIQVLGGTGFSWEHDAHLYLKRAKGNEVALGDPIYHREKVAQLLTAGL